MDWQRNCTELGHPGRNKHIMTNCGGQLKPPGRRPSRPRTRGKFIFLGDEKLYVRGACYGTFRPDEDGSEFRDPEAVERDFAQMAANGANAVRTYNVPPRWLLDVAQRNGLYVMVGLPWEQHVTFLDDPKRADSIEDRVRAGVRACTGHPAVLCYAIGNEIPAPIVRWHGQRLVERYVERLYRAAKAEDPHGLFTYVNYPTTEYLQLPFLDVVCFNVYLESQERFEAYLARLHNLAGDRPLIMGEIGLDSRRHGEQAQAQALDWQLRSAFGGGCAGAFVFSWTDEWYRGGYDIEDWDFGLTRRDRGPKAALAAVRKAFEETPFPPGLAWPRISVVVCTRNGARTLHKCFEGVRELEYPNFEVIVVNDGSTDRTAEITRAYGFRLVSTPNKGLGAARNLGMEAATGEIVAYLDDDAYPDPHWLTYLAATFRRTTFAGVGGPNIPPLGNGSIADCIANAPGGPIHVLLTDSEAEHIPGCNMAFRKAALQAIGGFDPQFRAAGDDVDVCWRLQDQGWKLGYNPAAMVFHLRRTSARAYWKQQLGYGKAEALLERKWPGKYNAAGHLTWAGRVYGSRGLTLAPGWGRGRIYQGTWGSAPYQSLYQPAASMLQSLPLMPEWYLVMTALAALSAVGTLWRPLLFALPLLALAAAAQLLEAILSAAQASYTSAPSSLFGRLKLQSLTTFLHLLQPLARLCGRLRCGLTPWRQRGATAPLLPRPWSSFIWSENWHAPDEWLKSLEAALQAGGTIVVRGGDFDRWDLEARGGLVGAARTRTVVEEHGAGKQMVRFRSWPRCTSLGIAMAGVLAFLGLVAVFNRAWAAGAILGAMALLIALRMFQECAVALAALARGIKECELRFLSGETLTSREARFDQARIDSVLRPHQKPEVDLPLAGLAPVRVRRIMESKETS